MNAELKINLDTEFEHLWKWFEIHISHRTSMLRFLLLAAGILAVAYVRLLEDGNPILPSCLASVGSIISMSFFMLDIITFKKIEDARICMRRFLTNSDVEDGGPDLFKLLDKKPRPRLMRDRVWTRIVQGTLVITFVAAAIYPWL